MFTSVGIIINQRAKSKFFYNQSVLLKFVKFIKMWKLIGEAERIQNNIIKAEVQMKKIKQRNAMIFLEQNQFMQGSSIKQSRQIDDAGQCFMIQLNGKKIEFQVSEQWENLKDKIQLVLGRKMSDEGIQKIMGAFGIEKQKIECLSSQQRSSQQKKVMKNISCPQNIEKQSHNLLKKQNPKYPIDNKNKGNMLQGKQNQKAKRGAYMEIHRRKRDLPNIR